MTGPKKQQKGGKKKSPTPPPRRKAAANKRRNKTKAYKPYKMRLMEVFWLVPLAIVIGFGGVFGFFAGEEVRKSTLQAEFFSKTAKEISFVPLEGPSPDFWTPVEGPYNRRLGYSALPFFIKALEGEGYEIARQARVSARYKELVDNGFYPVYRAKTESRMTIGIRGAETLYAAHFPSHVFPNFESLPPLLVDTLLFIENRELLKDSEPTRNPVIEWKRFVAAGAGQVLKRFIKDVNLGGGSTLATQIEKFRFSPDGQTKSSMDKFRQIVSGSLRVYLDGTDTRAARRKIVLDYVNSTPLSARAGFGEVNGLGDGFWVWFGRDLSAVREALALSEDDSQALRRKAAVYRETLALFLAQRRPSYYLIQNRQALEDLTDQMLDKLAVWTVISPVLREAARAERLRFSSAAPEPKQADLLDQKAGNALRTHLLSLLGVRTLYDLDRLDMSAKGTIDAAAQSATTKFLKNMGNPEFLRSIGLYGDHLLSPENNPSVINWSVLLYEKTDKGNVLRVQTDNIDGPLDMNEGGKLDLGSTAKLRTLVTYLEIMSELFGRYAGFSVEELRALLPEAPDALTEWAIGWLAENPSAELESMLNAAMERTYSASPNEVFFTGGGEHTFVNFNKESNGKTMNLREALRDSVNLVFIRLMREIVNHEIAQERQEQGQDVLRERASPARQTYLERYADEEGRVFLGRFLKQYDALSPDAALQFARSRARKSPVAQTVLFRAIAPTAPFERYVAHMRQTVRSSLPDETLRVLFKAYPPTRYTLADQGYIVGLHPLELWLAAYKAAHPRASRKEILDVSRPVRIQSYAWLLSPRKKKAQDTRIRILLEQDAFARIQKRWARLGYPFEKLVPSLATAIGSSADRPASLAALLGILLNDGVRLPLLRMEEISFAEDTPYETVMRPIARVGEAVLNPAVTRVVRAAMAEVVENGTARRLRGVYVDENGQPLTVGAKTGTGDHRFDEYGPGNRLISSRVVNRTGTIAFFIGDKFFGAVTAHVAGAKAEKYAFTSALSAQVLKALEPALHPLVAAKSVVLDERRAGADDGATVSR